MNEWDNAAEWLLEKVEASEDIEYVKGIVRCLILSVGLDMDAIEDEFQSEMFDDGYYDE